MNCCMLSFSAIASRGEEKKQVANAMTYPGPSAFTALPPELLHHILSFLSPTDLASLCKSSRTFDNYINSSDYLWSQIYSFYWDVPDYKFTDAVLYQPCPDKRSLSTRKGKRITLEPKREAAEGMPRKGQLYLDSMYPFTSHQFDHKEQAKRRVWAEKRLNSVHSRQIDLYANYNDTLLSLLSIVRSRLPRKHARDQERQSLSNKYLLDLLTSTAASDEFRRVIYPRADARRLREWQLKSFSDKCKNSNKSSKMTSRDIGKRARSVSSSNALPQQKKRKASEMDIDHMQRRRSTRLLLGAYPFELHHLLSDSEGHSLIDLEDDRGVSGLEDLELIDEQLAAELHVLHGILPSTLTTPKENGAAAIYDTAVTSEAEESRSEEEEEEEGEDGESDSDFVVDEDEEEMEWSHLNLEGTTSSRDRKDKDVQSRLRGQAREIVYDTARFGPENAFGPFMAYRERWPPLDGVRATEVRAQNDFDVEPNEDEDDQSEVDSTTRREEEVIEEEEGLRGEANDHDDADNGVEMVRVTHPYVEEGLEEEEEEEVEEDDNFEVDRDDDDDEDDDMLFEGRELLIAASRGILPYYESQRLQRASSEYGIPLFQSKSNPSKVSIDEEAIEISEMLPNTKQLDKVWRMEKRIDWIVVEAIMVCMHANITHAVKDHQWGRHFTLPGNTKSLNGGDEEAVRLNSTLRNKRWQNILGLPCGWSHSRGDASKVPPLPSSKDAKTVNANDHRKPFDWAGVESSWIGTYSFLDWSRWAAYNARDPLARGIPEESIATDPTKPFIRGDQPPSLCQEREAIGDCLQLQMELLPLEEQHAVTFQQRALEELEGQGNSTFPPLRFRGRTRTYDQEPPIPRGLVHGIVRPIFAPLAQGQEMTSCEGRAIIGLDWSISHSYEGEDRWSLSGVQPGPPGSRCPIYGIWGSSRRTDALSPCGPFIYYRVA